MSSTMAAGGNIKDEVRSMELASDDIVDDIIVSIMTEIDALSGIGTDAAVSIRDVNLEHRLHCLKILASAAKNMKIDVMTNESALIEQLSCLLEEDVKTLDKLKLEKAQAIQEDENLLESLQQQLAQLREGKILRQAEGEMKEMDDIEVVLRKSKQLFKKTRDDLDIVLDMLLGSDSEMKSIILAVTKAYFTGDDAYVKVENEKWIPRLELLQRGRIITYHPYDKKKIRLATIE